MERHCRLSNGPTIRARLGIWVQEQQAIHLRMDPVRFPKSIRRAIISTQGGINSPAELASHGLSSPNQDVRGPL